MPAWVTVTVAVAPPDVTVTVPVLAAVVGFAVTESVIVVFAAHAAGAKVNHVASEAADQPCWLELMTIPVDWARCPGAQVVADSVTLGGMVAPACVTTKAAFAPPAVTVTVPVLAAEVAFAITSTVIRAPPGPVAGATVSHAWSLEADQVAWLV